MDVNKIRKCPWNPRRMNKESREALKSSIKTFDDISGIVVNKRTGNILAGNHRWDEVASQHGGPKNLVLNHLKGEYFSLDTKNGVHTGFLVRVVEWDKKKEKAANVTANSDLISGEFTTELQDVLHSIEDWEGELFEELRLDELQIDLDGVDEDLDLSENFDKIQESAEERNRQLQDAKGEEAQEVRDIRSVIKVSCPSDLKDEVKDDLMEFLAKRKYYNDITIV